MLLVFILCLLHRAEASSNGVQRSGGDVRGSQQVQAVVCQASACKLQVSSTYPFCPLNLQLLHLFEGVWNDKIR